MTVSASEERNLETMAAVVPFWNRHDVAGILKHYDDGIIWNDMAMGRTYRGKLAVGAFLHALFDAVPDLTLELNTQLPHGDSVAEEYTITGTHLGSLFGVPATGKRLRIHAVSFVRLRDARFAEDNFYFDAASLMHQLGLFPSLTLGETLPGRILLSVAVFLRSPRRALRRYSVGPFRSIR